MEKKVYTAKLNNLAVSPRKLGLIAKRVRNSGLKKSMLELDFINKKGAIDVKKCLNSAIANAEDIDGLNQDDLEIKEIYVTEGLTLKRGKPVARGRFHRINRRRSNLVIKLQAKQ